MQGCPDEDDVAAFVRGDVEPARAAEIEKHLDGCPSCSRVVADLVRIFDPSADGQRSASAQSVDVTETEQSSTMSLEEEVPALPAGAEVGRYKVLDCIGIGGMGVVYGAYDPELDRKVALKVLRRGLAGDQERRNVRLRREAQAMAKIADPNVITVHDVGLFQGRVFLAMEFVEGTTLGKWMRARTRSFKEVRDVFAAAGAGLAAAHRAGLVHRDFKPDNVLIGHDGRVRVTDFGLASFRDGAAPEDTDTGSTDHEDEHTGSGPLVVETLTKTGMLVGTPAYMPPEAYSGRRVTAASDQFSYCVAMYEALYGERPFDGRTLAELATNVTSGSIRQVRDARVPTRIRELLFRGLQVDPAKRFPNMQTLLVVLNRRPSRTARRWAMVIAPLALAVVGFWWDSPRAGAGVAFCGDEFAIDGAWSETRASRVRDAFANTAVPWAPTAANEVVSHLDDWTARWTAARDEVCVAGAKVSELPQQEAFASHCLLRQRARLESLLEVFDAPDAETIDRALAAVGDLPDPQQCRDEQSMANVVPMPSAEEQDLVAEFRQHLERAAGKATAGRHSEALAIALEVDEAARGLEYGPLQAEARYEVGRLQVKTGELQKARATLEEAAWLGVEVHNRKIAAQAWIELVFLDGVELRDFGAAHRALRAAEAEVAAFGEDIELQHRLLVHGATLAIEEGRFEEAMAALQKVLAETQGSDPAMERTDLLFNIAGVEAETGRYEEAEQHYRQYIAMYEQHYGAVHPDIASGHFNLATVLYRQRRHAEALVEFRRSAEIEDAAVDEDHPRRADTNGAIGETLVALKRSEEALHHFELAVKLASRDGGSAAQAAYHRIALADVLVELQRLDDAGDALREAKIELDEMGDEVPAYLPRWHTIGARLAVARGDRKTARKHAEAAVAAEQKFTTPNALELAERKLDLADIVATDGDHDRARALAEDVLASTTDAGLKSRARALLTSASRDSGG